MRAITQGELERIKIYMCRAVWTALYCCLCSLRELELLHKETVYLCINPYPWYILICHWNKILNRQCEEIELFAEQLLKNNCRTNSHDHWYLHCASMLFEAQCLTPFYLLSSKPATAPSVERQDRTDCLERWIEITLWTRTLPSCANTPVCRDPVCHSSSALYSRFREICIHCGQDTSCALD